MSGQYQLTKEEELIIRKLVENNITTHNGDLFEDNIVSIKYAKSADFDGDGWFYIQFN